MAKVQLEGKIKEETTIKTEKTPQQYDSGRIQKFSPQYTVVKEYCGVLNGRACKCSG